MKSSFFSVFKGRAHNPGFQENVMKYGDLENGVDMTSAATAPVT